jgi:lipoprotein-releasing system ATP-binding protein
MTVLEAIGLTKTFIGGDGGLITVLDGVNLHVARGEMVAIVGASGAGKSTLLHLVGALDRPTRGSVVIDGERVDGLADDQLSVLRNRRVGFVFQFHHLLREFTALENVMMPLRIAGWEPRRSEARATELLDRVRLASRARHRP